MVGKPLSRGRFRWSGGLFAENGVIAVAMHKFVGADRPLQQRRVGESVQRALQREVTFRAC